MLRRPIRGYAGGMLAASHFLLWIAVVLLGVGWFSLARQMRALRAATPGDTPPPRVPVVSTATLTGEAMTIGRASRDGRALLLLFLAAGCTRSAAALREAIAFSDPARIRLVLVGEGEAADYAPLARLHQLPERDMVIGGAVAADLGIVQRPAAMLVAADGATLAAGLVDSRDKLGALLATLPRTALRTPLAERAAARIATARAGLAGRAAIGR